MSRDSHLLFAKARDLTDRFKAGGRETPGAFREVVQFLLGLTVMDKSRGAVRLITMTEGDNFALGSQEGPDVGIPLRDQKWLRLAMRLYVAPSPT